MSKKIIEEVTEETKEVARPQAKRDGRRFSELMAYSAFDAAQYCVDCGNDTEIYGKNVKDIVAEGKIIIEPRKIITLDVKEDAVVEKTVETPEVKEIKEEIKEEIEISIEDLQEALKSKGIKFHHKAGKEKLLELAKTNGLL